MTGEEMGGWVRRENERNRRKRSRSIEGKDGRGVKERQTGRRRQRGMGRVEQNAVKEEEEMEDGWREEANKM